jgi:hypothetical protein
MTAAAMTAAAMMAAGMAMTEMFAMMAAAVAMTELFTMMAAVTDQKPAGKAVVRIGIGIIASVVGIVRPVVGVVTGVVRPDRAATISSVISASARNQRGHQQSRQNPSSGDLPPPAPDRFQLEITCILWLPGQRQAEAMEIAVVPVGNELEPISSIHFLIREHAPRLIPWNFIRP